MKKLLQIFKEIDGKGYPNYKRIQGIFKWPHYEVAVNYVQGDPFASPSKICLHIPLKNTGVKEEWLRDKYREICCKDYITRLIHKSLKEEEERAKGSGKSGMILIDYPGQEVINRTSVTFSASMITVSLSVGLPAKGRRILGKQAELIFKTLLPTVVEKSIFQMNIKELEMAIILTDQQQAVRSYLKEHELVSFVANGSILPRKSGVSELPLQKAVPFQSPEELEIAIPIPHTNKELRGMGVKKGVTVIVGGGYHGKSTLLQGIERGVYNYRKGDGREFVITENTAVKIRAEDGRNVEKVDISLFVNNLPNGGSTAEFSSENASGSTSQAANIIEALEAGARTLVIDEDTSATNFMIRDMRMKELISPQEEPITPFIDRVSTLYEQEGISSILVMGGSGAYFEKAHTVLKLNNYKCTDVTNQAKEIAAKYPEQQEDAFTKHRVRKERIVRSESLQSEQGRKRMIKVRSKDTIQYGKSIINLHYVEQLVNESQTRAIAGILSHIERKNLLCSSKTMKDLLEYVQQEIERHGLKYFASSKKEEGELAEPRVHEIAAALNRLRSLSVR
ncbi:ABC-ATPase domain-containing protein [Priestia endophytica]|nr:ABC-ATPase domain-containing protein [Priestia endophytica]MBG9811271.1 ABC transporter ATPase [Priestia endophytica]